MTDARRIALFGLGSMDLGMARSLLRAGHATYGLDVADDRVTAFRSEGGATGEIACATVPPAFARDMAARCAGLTLPGGD